MPLEAENLEGLYAFKIFENDFEHHTIQEVLDFAKTIDPEVKIGDIEFLVNNAYVGAFYVRRRPSTHDSGLEKSHKVIGCITEQLIAGNYFSNQDKLCEHIAKLSGIPEERVKIILEESKKVWRSTERKVFNL